MVITEGEQERKTHTHTNTERTSDGEINKETDIENTEKEKNDRQKKAGKKVSRAMGAGWIMT